MPGQTAHLIGFIVTEIEDLDKQPPNPNAVHFTILSLRRGRRIVAHGEPSGATVGTVATATKPQRGAGFSRSSGAATIGRRALSEQYFT